MVRQLARVEHFADQTQLGEWLRKQSDASITALWRLIRDFIAWVVERADAARWTYAGRAEVFFDDTQIEVFGPSFEGAQINYNGDLSLSWQTMWFGPFLADGQLGSPGDVSGALPAMLEQNRHLWAERASDFLADSGSSSAEYLQAIASGFHPLECQLQQVDHRARAHRHCPASERLAPAPTTLARRHCHYRTTHPHPSHTRRQSASPFRWPPCAWKKEGEMFWRYAFVACDEQRTDAAAILARHRLKGGKEQLFKEVLRGLDLHHPPCESLRANRMFYAIGALAYNLMEAVQLLCLPDECQSWTVRPCCGRWCGCRRCW